MIDIMNNSQYFWTFLSLGSFWKRKASLSTGNSVTQHQPYQPQHQGLITPSEKQESRKTF